MAVALATTHSRDFDAEGLEVIPHHLMEHAVLWPPRPIHRRRTCHERVEAHGPRAVAPVIVPPVTNLPAPMSTTPIG
jgi:hypothetical protein